MHSSQLFHLLHNPVVLQVTPCLGSLQPTHQDLLQRQQALDEWHRQLACNAHSLEQQKQSCDQQQRAWSADMNRCVADKLQHQKTELDQRYMPAIRALEQQLEAARQTAAKETGKAAEVLQQKEQEWKGAFANAQQEAQQAQQAMLYHKQPAQSSAEQTQQSIQAAQQQAQEAQQALQQLKASSMATAQSAKQEAARRQQELETSLQAAQQLAQQAGAQAQQAEKQATAWRAEASTKASRLAEVELKLQQVGMLDMTLQYVSWSGNYATAVTCFPLGMVVRHISIASNNICSNVHMLTFRLLHLCIFSWPVPAQLLHHTYLHALHSPHLMHCIHQKLLHCTHVQAVLSMPSQAQQHACKPCANMCNGINKPSGGSSSAGQDLAEQMASLCTERRAASTRPAAAASSAPAAGSLLHAASQGAISLLALCDGSSEAPAPHLLLCM